MKRGLCFVFLMSFLVGTFSAPAGCSYRRTYKDYAGDSVSKGEVAKVILPRFMELVSVDGESTGKWLQKLFVSGVEKELEVLPGDHTISVVYLEIWPINDNDDEKLRSDPLELTFTAEAGKKYRVAGHEPEDLESARRYEANFKAWIVDVTTGKQVSQ